MVTHRCEVAVDVFSVPTLVGDPGVFVYHTTVHLGARVLVQYAFVLFHSADQGREILATADWLPNAIRDEYSALISRGVFMTQSPPRARVFLGEAARIMGQSLRLCIQREILELGFDDAEIETPVSFNLEPVGDKSGLIGMCLAEKYYVHVYHSRSQIQAILQRHSSQLSQGYISRFVRKNVGAQVLPNAEIEAYHLEGSIAQRIIIGHAMQLSIN